MINQSSIKKYNLPSDISTFEKQQDDDFCSSLQNLLDSYEFLHQGGISKISAALIYNKQTPDFVDTYQEKLYFCSKNYPTKITTTQSVKDSVFRARLDLLLKKYPFENQGSIRELIVCLYYNKSVDEIQIKGLEYMKPEEESRRKEPSNEEGLTTFTTMKPKYHLKQVVLNDDLEEQILKTLKILEHRYTIYEDWGFSAIDPEPKAILNFYGPPGTGKTMTAHAIANKLDTRILSLNYADIESKFVGDAPKNLVRAFENASQEKALLFFDEADSFLGKRISNVSSSSDQAVNSLRSQMLILLENFDGIVIFATNLVKNYDKAFESRIFKHLKFDLPNEHNRKIIIEKTIPPQVPFQDSQRLTEQDFEVLVKLSEGFGGREIKNAILDALITAISDGRMYVCYSDFISSFEYKKKSRDNLLNETNDSEVRKKALTEKIKENLKKEEYTHSNVIEIETDSSLNQTLEEQDLLYSLMDIATRAALADNTIQSEEREVLEKTATAFKLNYVIADSIEKMPSLSEIVKAFDTPEKKIKALDFVIHIVIADGILDDAEISFLNEFCKELGIEDRTQEVVDFAQLFVQREEHWRKFKTSILDKSLGRS